MTMLCNGSFIAICSSVELNGKHKIKMKTLNEKELNGKHKKKRETQNETPKPSKTLNPSAWQRLTRGGL
jgi:hypothetical protein